MSVQASHRVPGLAAWPAQAARGDGASRRAQVDAYRWSRHACCSCWLLLVMGARAAKGRGQGWEERGRRAHTLQPPKLLSRHALVPTQTCAHARHPFAQQAGAAARGASFPSAGLDGEGRATRVNPTGWPSATPPPRWGGKPCLGEERGGRRGAERAAMHAVCTCGRRAPPARRRRCASARLARGGDQPRRSHTPTRTVVLGGPPKPAGRRCAAPLCAPYARVDRAAA